MANVLIIPIPSHSSPTLIPPALPANIASKKPEFNFLTHTKMADVTVTDLAANLVQVGHRSERWNPRMKSYLAGQKDGVYVFDLDQTAEKLEKAKGFLAAQKIANKKVLFVGTKEPIALEIQKQLKDTNHFYVDRKWTPGLLTNFKEIRKRVDYYLSLKSQFESGEIQKYTKKEEKKINKKGKEMEKRKNLLLARGKEKGFVTYDEILKEFPDKDFDDL